MARADSDFNDPITLMSQLTSSASKQFALTLKMNMADAAALNLPPDPKQGAMQLSTTSELY